MVVLTKTVTKRRSFSALSQIEATPAVSSSKNSFSVSGCLGIAGCFSLVSVRVA